MKHVSTKYLWLQERVASKDISIGKVATDKQLADVLTKIVSMPAMLKAMERMGMSFREGRAKLQKRLL